MVILALGHDYSGMVIFLVKFICKIFRFLDLENFLTIFLVQKNVIDFFGLKICNYSGQMVILGHG